MKLSVRLERMPRKDLLGSLLPSGINMQGQEPLASMETVAGALGYARLPLGADLLCRVKYLYQPEKKPRLWSHLLVRYALPAAMKQDWKAGLMAQLCHASIHEAIQERQICPVCGGKGHVIKENKAVKCVTCDTKGWIGFNKEHISKQLGIPVREYISTWEPRYKFLLGVLNDWDDQIEKALTKHWGHTKDE